MIRPGEPLLEITQEDKHIVLEISSKPDDLANMRNGLPARARIVVFDYATYGAFQVKGHRSERGHAVRRASRVLLPGEGRCREHQRNQA